MKKKLLLLSVLSIAAVALSGCVSTPETKITGTLFGKPLELKLPKDDNIENFDFTASTNGTFHLTIGKLTATNSPSVIGASGTYQTGVLGSISTSLQSLLQGAAGLVGTAAKAP